MPAWKRLVNRPVMIERRIDLIKVIFADRNELEAVKRLCGGDAQAFVDVLDEVLPCAFISEAWPTEPKLKPYLPSSRR